MDHSYNFPHRRQDDYALTILTQAAMQTHTNSNNNNINNDNDNSHNSDGRASNSDYSNDQRHQTNQSLTTRPHTTEISREPSSISNQQSGTSHYRIPPSVPNL